MNGYLNLAEPMTWRGQTLSPILVAWFDALLENSVRTTLEVNASTRAIDTTLYWSPKQGVCKQPLILIGRNT